MSTPKRWDRAEKGNKTKSSGETSEGAELDRDAQLFVVVTCMCVDVRRLPRPVYDLHREKNNTKKVDNFLLCCRCW